MEEHSENDGEANSPAPAVEVDGLGESEVFVLRLWREEAPGGEAGWHGKIQNILSAEAHYFRGWPGLIHIVEDVLPGTEAVEAQHGDTLERPEEDSQMPG